MTEDLPPDGRVLRRLCREPWKRWTREGAILSVPCDVHDWTRQGTEGFLGYTRCQGQSSGEDARRQRALVLMDGWCGAQSRCHGKENWDASEAANRGECTWRNATGKSCQKLCMGDVLPLDRRLLMGGVSSVRGVKPSSRSCRTSSCTITRCPQTWRTMPWWPPTVASVWSCPRSSALSPPWRSLVWSARSATTVW